MSDDYYDLIVEGRLKSNGKWVELATFHMHNFTGKIIQRGFWIFKWEEEELVEDKQRVEKAVAFAKNAMTDSQYQDIRIQDYLGLQDDLYRHVWLNGRWHQHY